MRPSCRVEVATERRVCVRVQKKKRLWKKAFKSPPAAGWVCKRRDKKILQVEAVGRCAFRSMEEQTESVGDTRLPWLSSRLGFLSLSLLC